MTKKVAEPTSADLRKLLGNLLDDSISLKDGDAVEAPAFLCAYDDDSNELRALLAVDLAFAAAAGGALGLMSPDGVKEIVEEGEVTNIIRENFREVANIFASLMCNDESVHVRLTEIHSPASEAPARMQQLLSESKRKVGFAVSLARYGGGQMCFYLT